jgi:hypothetical protein
MPTPFLVAERRQASPAAKKDQVLAPEVCRRESAQPAAMMVQVAGSLLQTIIEGK